jgi:hypothetical protein
MRYSPFIDNDIKLFNGSLGFAGKKVAIDCYQIA